jgi:hypothetical protein
VIASQLSNGNTLPPQQALLASQVAFIMSDIDSQVTLYATPDRCAGAGIVTRLESGKKILTSCSLPYLKMQKPGCWRACRWEPYRQRAG